MIEIITGTTPTIKYQFSETDVANIVSAYLTIKKDAEVIVKLPMSSAAVEEKTIAWTLTQAQTLKVGSGIAKAMLNWKTQDGTRGTSGETEIRFKANHIPEVI